MEHKIIGKTILHFKILAKLGQGSMGIVYKAQDLKLKRSVALKFLPIYLADDKQARLRFIQEAQVTASLQHPNIAITYDFIEIANEKIIVMEYLEGETLAEIIRRRQPNLKQILDWSINIAEGLFAAHTKGIIHRDIKPANIMITRDGGTKITDFGIAKLRGTLSFTPPGERIGTLDYAAPELVMGDKGDRRSDIFSLGVVLYELLSGQRPFCDEHDAAVVYAIVNEAPIPVTEICKDIPPAFERLVMKMLEKKREKRYQSCDVLLLELKQLKRDTLEGQLTLPLIKSKEIRKRKPVKIKTKSYLLKVAVPIFLALLLLFVFLQLNSIFLKQPSPMRPVPIAVMPFENQTGDKSLDYLKTAIPNLLITSLKQSQSLRVTTWERMRDIFKQLGKEDMEGIDKDLGFELCRKDNIETIVLGSFTKAGEVFATDVKIMDVKNKELMNSATAKGEGIASILNRQIDELSWEIFTGVGISSPDVKRAQRPVADVTTTSMEAYNYFLRGKEDYDRRYFNDARRFYEKAVQLDSSFATAYIDLADIYFQLYDPKMGREAYEKAMTFAHKATDREQLFIRAHYARVIERNLGKWFELLKKIAKNYPKDKTVHYHLGRYFMDTKQFYKAIEELNKALGLDPSYGDAINSLAITYTRIRNVEQAIEYIKRYAAASPGHANPFDTMASFYFSMGRLDEAIDKYREAIEVRPDFFQAHWSLCYVYAFSEDYTKALEYFERSIAAATYPGIKAVWYMWRGFYNYWLGNIEGTFIDLQQAENYVKMTGNDLQQAQLNWIKAWIHYYRGEIELGRTCYKSALDVFRKNWYLTASYSTAAYYFYLGLGDLKKNGRIDSAKAMLGEINSLFPETDPQIKEWIFSFYNLLYGEVLLAEGSLEDAITVCKKAVPLGGGHWGMTFYSLSHYNLPLIQKYVLARAYLEKKELKKAISEYERLITFNPNSRDRFLIHPVYHYRLAKLYEQKGWPEKAIEQYERFLQIWKDANEDLPELISAKARLAKLKGLKIK